MNRALNRKITYLLALIALFTAMVVLSPTIQASADRNQISQSSLGKVNPVSGTAQLVCLGFRGVAVTFLWNDLIELKKEERWFEMKPVIESVTLLQPHFSTPWQFQAWNLAYNVAAEWEAVKDKYYWIREGIEFMKNSNVANSNNPDLLWYNGWLYYNRFGMADEKTYLRELFKKETDKEFAGNQTRAEQDNFETAFDIFSEAVRTVVELKREPKRMGTIPFLTYRAKSKTSYAEFRQIDGFFGEATRNDWLRAIKEWRDYGLGFGIGEPGRDKLVHRFEFTPSEFEKLTEEERYWVQRHGNVVMYHRWKKRCEAEAEPITDSGREAFYKANLARKAADYVQAISLFEKAFPIWIEAVKRFPVLLEEANIVEDAQLNEEYYLRLLARLNMPLPAKRPFDGLIDAYPKMPDSMPTARDLQRPSESPATATVEQEAPLGPVMPRKAAAPATIAPQVVSPAEVESATPAAKK